MLVVTNTEKLLCSTLPQASKFLQPKKMCSAADILWHAIFCWQTQNSLCTEIKKKRVQQFDYINARLRVALSYNASDNPRIIRIHLSNIHCLYIHNIKIFGPFQWTRFSLSRSLKCIEIKRFSIGSPAHTLIKLLNLYSIHCFLALETWARYNVFFFSFCLKNRFKITVHWKVKSTNSICIEIDVAQSVCRT